MEQRPVYVGIDIAKAHIDVATRPGDQTWRVSYDEEGLRGLAADLEDINPEVVLLEATGGLELPLPTRLW